MNRIHAEIDRTSLFDKVMNAESALWREVPDRSTSGSSLGDELSRWEFVSGIDQSTCALKPRLPAFRCSKEIPAENHWSYADAPECSSTKRHNRGASA